MTFHVQVEPKNPGQFLACCGLLELADRLCPGAEGWFEPGQFRVECGPSLKEILQALLWPIPEAPERVCETIEVKPLIAPLVLILKHDEREVPLRLDGWMTVRIEKGVPVAVANPPWNFWSGMQTSLRIWTALRAAMSPMLDRIDEAEWPRLFSRHLPLRGRFGFDPGPAWNALDAGFSPNEQGIAVTSSPAVELLAAVGLQRFRPLLRGRDRFLYTTWGVPLPPQVAAAAMAGMIPTTNSTRYLGRIQSRGSYAALGYAIPFQGDPR